MACVFIHLSVVAFFHSLVRSCVLLIGWIVRFTEWSDVFLLCFWEGDDSRMCENVL